MAQYSSSQLEAMPLEELKALLNKELSIANPNYEFVGKLSELVAKKEHSKSEQYVAAQVQQVHQTAPITYPHKGPNFFKAPFVKFGENKLKFYTFLGFVILTAFYYAIWFFRMSGLNEVEDFYNQNVVIRTLFGWFGAVTVGTYAIYYFLKENFKTSTNYDKKITSRALIILLISSIFDLSLLLGDINAEGLSFLNTYLYSFLLSISFILKAYAYTLFFRTKDNDNYFVQNNLGLYARLTDYQYIVYLFGGIFLLILSISAALVAAYDIDPWRFVMGFLLPFCLVTTAGLFSLSYFDFNKRIAEQFSLVIKLLTPVVTFIISVLTVPIAAVFFLIHASFLFSKVFDFKQIDNPTIIFSQVYVFLTLGTVLSYFVVKTLNSFKLSSFIDKVLKFSIIFHLFYSIIGIIFATIGLFKRIQYYGYTDNRIYGLFILGFEFIVLVYILLKLLDFKARKFTDKISDYNEIYKLLFVAPVLVFFTAWVLFGVIRFDEKNVINKLKNSRDLKEFTIYSYGYDSESGIKTGDNYILNTISDDLVNLAFSNSQKDKIIDKYLKDSSDMGQIFIIMNAGELRKIDSYQNLSSDVKNLFKDYRDSEYTYDYYDTRPSSNRSVQSCNEDLFKILSDYDKNNLEKTFESWDLYRFTNNYRKINFWKACMGLDEFDRSYNK